MSYTRSYRESVSGSVSVSYPASQNGGSTTAYIEIPVIINIHVDTEPFDTSVEDCSSSVNYLTAAVVATEAAEIASKKANAERIGQTLTNGFFGYIKSEISQQVSSLSDSINSQLLHLRELVRTCSSKKKQMESDYLRISQRYIKIFEELNHELSNRITELDRKIFQFQREVKRSESRMMGNDSVNTAAVFSGEMSGKQSKLSNVLTKRIVIEVFKQSQTFLTHQQVYNSIIENGMIRVAENREYYAPVVGIEFKLQNSLKSIVYSPDELVPLKARKVEIEKLMAAKLVRPDTVPIEIVQNIGFYFNIELSNAPVEDKKLTERVKQTIKKLSQF